MDDGPHPQTLTSPVSIRRADSLTAFGNTSDTVAALLQNKSALTLTPVYGEDGGEGVPLALRQPMHRTIPPRWWEDLMAFLGPIADEEWGTLKRPIMVCSSNYGIDGLYGLGKERNKEYAAWATPHGCMEKIIAATNWGSNVSILSHACVSAQLGIYKAAEMLHSDIAEEVLVLSFDYVGPFVSAGFHSLKILNGQMPAPYAAIENGSIGLGDGIGYAVLAKSGDLPRISAQSLYNEMYHFTANTPGGAGFSKTLCGIKNITGDRKLWIKGHGTGTLEAGKMEAEACASLFHKSPLVSWKGALGHTLGSCALVELTIALESIKAGRVPGTVGTSGPCFTENVATEAFDACDYNTVLLLSNAFGGAHGAMLLET